MKFSFKLLLWCYTFAFAPIYLVSGLLALFGAHTTEFNNKPLTGIGGLAFNLLAIPLSAIGFATFNWMLLNFGFWILKKIRGTDGGSEQRV